MEGDHPDLPVAQTAARVTHKALQTLKTGKRQHADAISALARVRDTSHLTPQERIDAVEQIARKARKQSYAITKHLQGVIEDIERTTNARPMEAQRNERTEDSTHIVAA